MSRRLALLALVVADLGCNGRIRILNWAVDEDDFPASSGETTDTTAASEGTTEGSAAASTNDTTGGSTDTSTETSTPSTESGTHTETTADTTDSSSSMTGPPCGNGMCAPDENNNNCPQDCEPACGNMAVETNEDCDDGNNDNTDACVECKDAACGDGFVQAGAEECDDGDQVDGDECRNDCTIPRRIVFVTSTSYTGDLGGISGADDKCNSAAEAASLQSNGEKKYKAWLSDADSNPSMRFHASMTTFQGIYELVDKTTVAFGWEGLTTFTLENAINRTENVNDNVMLDVNPWSNTAMNGTGVYQAPQCCENWGTNAGGKTGPIGHAMEGVVSAEWTNFTTQVCSNPTPLYCFEDHP